MSEQMKEYTVVRDGERDLRFTGTLVASAASTPDKARGSYSGSTGRWSEFSLYRTKAGKFVCEMMEGTQWQGEHNRHLGEVCDTEGEIVAFFGGGRLAKELYREAGIDATETVE